MRGKWLERGEEGVLESGLRKADAPGSTIGDGGRGDVGREEKGRGEDGRDCTGERVKGPERKLPARDEIDGGEEGDTEVAIKGRAFTAADLGTAEVLSHPERFTHSILGRSLDAMEASGGTTSFSWSLSLSSSWLWLFH